MTLRSSGQAFDRALADTLARGKNFAPGAKNPPSRPYPKGTFSVIEGVKRSGYAGLDLEREFCTGAKNPLHRPYPNGTFSVIKGARCNSA